MGRGGRTSGRAQGQVDAEQRAGRAGRRIGEPDRAAVEGRHPARDGEAQSGPARGRALDGVGQRAEPLERALPVGGCDPRPLVGDVQPPPFGSDVAGDPHPPALGAVPDRVVEHVGEQLAEPGGVGLHLERLGYVDVEPHGPAGGYEVGHHLVDQGSDPHRAEPQRCHARLHAGELEQVTDQGADPLGLVHGPAEVLRVGRTDAVGEVLEGRGECGQRRPELVGDGGHEVALLVVDAGELGRHLVERAGQLADLVGGVGAHPPPVVAPGHPAGRFGHLPQRRGHADGEQLGDGEREGNGHGYGEQHRYGGTAGERADQRGDQRARGDQQPQLDLDRGERLQRRAHAPSPRCSPCCSAGSSSA